MGIVWKKKRADIMICDIHFCPHFEEKCPFNCNLYMTQNMQDCETWNYYEELRNSEPQCDEKDTSDQKCPLENTQYVKFKFADPAHQVSDNEIYPVVNSFTLSLAILDFQDRYGYEGDVIVFSSTDKIEWKNEGIVRLTDK